MNPIIFSSLVFIIIRPLSTRAGRSILCDEQIKATIRVSPSNQTRYFWRDVAVPQVLPTVISGEKPCSSPPKICRESAYVVSFGTARKKWMVKEVL
jgi:hypothetical protein